jgi:predicted phosphodiesterase
MKYAVFSDIHSNYEALKTFLVQTDSASNLKRICLGDVVGYAARPNECIRLLIERDIPIIMGNHDYAIYSTEERIKFNDNALRVIEWHAQILLPEYRKMLVELPFSRKIGKLLSFTHADFSEPEKFHYVTTNDEAHVSMNSMPTPIGFFGHTHIPVVFTQFPDRENGDDIQCKIIKKSNHTLYLDQSARYMINPGSIGQPRDKDPKASFVVFDDEDLSVTFYRYNYNKKAESDCIRLAKLPHKLADRILVGN